MRLVTACALLALPILSAQAGEGFRWRIDIADEVHRPELPEAYSMSGIAWVSNDVYWTVTDEKRRPVVWELELPADLSNGKIGGCRMKILCRPEKALDLEGIACDPLDGSIWLADERAGCIKQYDPFTGRQLLGAVKLPKHMKRFAKDRGLESLTICDGGLSMWTCNEEALETDGSISTRNAGTNVRLTRFVRKTCKDPWKPVGQWMYRTDSIAGKPWCDKKGEDVSRSGVSELCQLEDGTLLVLEREFSVMLVPRFRCRVYETDFSGATEVMEIPSLSCKPPPKAVSKKLLCETTGFAMYEGMCLGPKLADGSRLLMLVSDGGDGQTLRTVLSLRLSRR